MGVNISETSNTDATGRTTRSSSTIFPQLYRLSYDNAFFPFLALSVGGTYQWNPGSTTSEGFTSEVSPNTWNVNARLTIGPPVLNVIPFYSRRQEFATLRAGGVTTESPTLVRESFGAYAGWNPVQLPALTLRLSRSLDYDTERAIQDRATNELAFTATYLEVRTLTLRYGLLYGDVEDRRRQVNTQDLLQSLQATWGDAFFDRRLTTYLSYSVGWRHSEVVATGSAGTVSTPRIPVRGLSLVELFPATPTRDTLGVNDLLVNGDLGASAGLDIGYAPSLGGDSNFRDVGAEFADSVNAVNLIHVWVDRPLPAAVWSTYSWTAYQSNDNLDWTPVPITAPVAFGTFDNRFEIAIASTRARYYKVVVRPLAPGVTVDPLYANVFVTEIQLFEVVPVTQAPARSDEVAGVLSGSARVLILRSPFLTYDFTGSLSHQNVFNLRSWSITNGLSFSERLSRVFFTSARVERTDSGQEGRPHAGTTRWSASLSAEPIPAAGASLVYSGQYQEGTVEQFAALGSVLTNSVTLSARADPYQGVSLSASVGYNYASAEEGRRSSGGNLGVNLTLTPHQTIVFTASYAATRNDVSGGGLPDRTDQNSALQATVSFTPVSAFFLSAGAYRSIGFGAIKPSTLANFSVGLSPFPRGQLLLRFGFNETLDTASEARTRLYGPGLRWNIRSGAYLDAAYTWTESVQPALRTFTGAFLAKLTISFR